MDSYHICYNLFTPEVSEIPCLPEAFVIATNNKGFSYIEKQATPEVLTGYAISFTDTPHEKLIQICDDLKPAALERRFKPTKKRKNLRLSELVLDPKTKAALLEYIHRKLITFYALVSKHQYRLCYHVQRKDPIEGFELTWSTNELLPILEFTKKSVGIEYSFSLKNKERILLPKDHGIVILLNDPAWIIIDKCIYQIKNLKISDIRIKEKMLRVEYGKGAKDRLIPMNERLIQILKEYINERVKLNKTSMYFFVALRGDKQMNDISIRRLFKRFKTELKMDVYPHKLRHTFATLMIKGGCTLPALA